MMLPTVNHPSSLDWDQWDAWRLLSHDPCHLTHTHTHTHTHTRIVPRSYFEVFHLFPHHVWDFGLFHIGPASENRSERRLQVTFTQSQLAALFTCISLSLCIMNCEGVATWSVISSVMFNLIKDGKWAALWVFLVGQLLMKADLSS